MCLPLVLSERLRELGQLHLQVVQFVLELFDPVGVRRKVLLDLQERGGVKLPSLRYITVSYCSYDTSQLDTVAMIHHR